MINFEKKKMLHIAHRGSIDAPALRCDNAAIAIKAVIYY
jgi:hypothetical protein